MLWCYHKKLRIWHFWKNMLFFLVSHFFIQGNGILVWWWWVFFPQSQNTETAFTLHLSKYFIQHKYHPRGLLQWFPWHRACLQLMGGARVWTNQNLKALREVPGHAEPWTTTSVAHGDTKNWLRSPDENFQLDLASFKTLTPPLCVK